MRKVIGLSGLALVLTACGGAVSTPKAAPTPSPSASASPTPTGPNVSGCFTEKDGKIFTYGDDDMSAVIAGEGSVGAVITYERGGDACTWRPLSDRLVAAGYRVLLYDRSADIVPAELIVDMAGHLAKEPGVKRLFLVGGSIGGTMSVSAATKLKGVAGVISLSGSPDEVDAAKLKVPLLQIGSETDTSGGAEALQRTHDAAKKAPDNQILIFKGQATHASDLFTTPQGPEALDRVLKFMDQHKG